MIYIFAIRTPKPETLNPKPEILYLYVDNVCDVSVTDVSVAVSASAPAWVYKIHT